jgi:tRNA pseudouridine55 synthase
MMDGMSEKRGEVPAGLILLRKKAGLTSFESLGEIKRSLGTGKVGHTGSLDKFAEGLLLVLTGRALKLSPWFSRCDKRYEGTIRFGIETDTLDPEGSAVFEAPPPSQKAVEQVLPQFTGEIMQAPPVYSAIHIDGKRASALARSGEIPEMKKRPARIYRLELRSWDPPFARIFVHCSSGTYIRSLARDIALAACSRAHLSALVRVQVAGFRLQDADGGENTAGRLRPIDQAVFSALGLSRLEVDRRQAEQIVHGKPLAGLLPPPAENLTGRPAGVFSDGNFIAIVENNGGQWKYGFVYAH